MLYLPTSVNEIKVRIENAVTSVSITTYFTISGAIVFIDCISVIKMINI